MAGRRETTCYWQWATCAERQAPKMGAEAIAGVEWVIEMLVMGGRELHQDPAGMSVWAPATAAPCSKSSSRSAGVALRFILPAAGPGP